jgi:translation initiation factor eIF-2B subunit delta
LTESRLNTHPHKRRRIIKPFIDTQIERATINCIILRESFKVVSYFIIHGAQKQMVERIIKQIAEDNRSGAAEILRRAAEALFLLGDTEQKDIEYARGAVVATCVAIVRAQPHMAPIVSLASEAVRAAHVATRPREVMQAAAASARRFSDNAALAQTAAISHAADLILEGETIMTHSRSSTVLAALKHARALGTRFSVIATESRPMLEGRALAASLASEGVSVTLIADAAAAMALDRVDSVLTGADKVTPEALVNKIGTRMIALAARERAVPVYAICDTTKFTAYSDLGLSAGVRSADELWTGAPQGVGVFNTYFEPTPLAYFTGIVTEDGMLQPEQARQRAGTITIHQALLDALCDGSA